MREAETTGNSRGPCFLKTNKQTKSNCLAQVIIFTNISPSSLKRTITGKDSRYSWVTICSLNKIVFNLSLFFSFLRQRSGEKISPKLCIFSWK